MTKALTTFQPFLRCPKCGGIVNTNDEAQQIVCTKDPSHNFPIEDDIPRFVKRDEISPEDAKWVFEYDDQAEQYDQAIEFYNDILETDLMREYLDLVRQLFVKDSQAILDVSVGTGNVNLAIQAVYPEISLMLAGVDLSIGFLAVAQRKFKKVGIESLLLHSQVHTLPFADNTFDIVTHSGGINTYSDIPRTLKEWVRVLKPEGSLIFVDEGLSPAVRKSERGKKILSWNTLFEAHPPLEHLPVNVKDIRLSWIGRGTFYVITCQKGET